MGFWFGSPHRRRRSHLPTKGLPILSAQGSPNPIYTAHRAQGTTQSRATSVQGSECWRPECVASSGGLRVLTQHQCLSAGGHRLTSHHQASHPGCFSVCDGKSSHQTTGPAVHKHSFCLFLKTESRDSAYSQGKILFIRLQNLGPEWAKLDEPCLHVHCW